MTDSGGTAEGATAPTILCCGPYPIERVRISAFAAALGDPHPAYTDPAAARALGHPDIIAPPTYLATLAAHAEDQLLGLQPDFASVEGTVHRAQTLRHARPAHVGDILHATVCLAAATTLAGRPLLTLDCEFRDEGGAWVATTTSSLLCPATAPWPARRPLDTTESDHP
ncbi:Acyl dehydratase [Streptomyces sp. 2112.3]|uniref:MaoC family dehydratase n=1 Tax=Streptomyces sp. 2112.3 TaxID=1881023 RepID=UPI000895B367|nr:MaoC family dehydratase [Streptomyces sp. 2112.3]SEE76018.1 Acyl dehydratase [Streptomyces sp. 2112.3]